MFFAVSKILGFFTVPSNALATLAVVGMVLLATRWRRAGLRLMACAVLVLLVIGYSPLGTVLLLTLSERFPPWQPDGRLVDGIVVLGGTINPEATAARGAVEVDASAERLLAVLALARRFPEARIVFSGGSASLVPGAPPEAPIAGRLLESLGVAPARIALESVSRTTAENAVLAKALAAPRPGERWLLVTSAFHMPRAVGAFRKAGFEVEAYPVDWRSRGWVDAIQPFGLLSDGLARADLAVHEWVGLIAYRLGGRSDELLPGPR